MKSFAPRTIVGVARLASSLCLVFLATHFAADFTPLCAQERSKDAPGTSVRELFNDPSFQNGFMIVDCARKEYRLGKLALPLPGEKTGKGTEPFWRIAQHASKYELNKGTVETVENKTSATTPGQYVAREKDESGNVVLVLATSTDKEYATPRKDGQRWVHLLLECDFPANERVLFKDADSVVFACDARVPEWSLRCKEEEYNPALHAAQASVYFVIPNVSPDSPDKGDYVWFGVSFFDSRTEVQNPYVAVDGDPKTIGTGKLIYRLGGQETIDDVLGGVNPYSGEWTHIEIDLKQRLSGALEAAHGRGFLTHTSLADLALSHFNFGWETPGTFYSRLEIRNPSLRASFHAATTEK